MIRKLIYLQLATMLFACRTAYGETGCLLQDTTTLKPIRLNEVHVSGRLNPLKIAPGRLTYQVAKGSAGSSGSALELLRRMPGVSILANGKISLNGQVGIQLLVDGKTNFMDGENLINFLASMPAASLDVVELITQPDATMDANGDARFINLKRINRTAPGLSVSLSTNAEQGKYSRTFQNIAVAANTAKLAMSHTYSYGEGTELIDVNSTRYISNGIDMRGNGLRLDMDAVRKRNYRNHYYNGTLDYAPNDHVKMGTYVLINNHERTKQEAVRSNFLNSSSQVDSSIATGNVLGHTLRNFSTGAHLTVQFGAGSKWENYLDRQQFNQSETQDQLLDKFGADGSVTALQQKLRGETGGKVTITTVQSKYMLDIRPNMTVSFGGKLTQVNMRTNSFYQQTHDNSWQERADLTNTFDHAEQLKALFMQTRFSPSDLFQIDVGLRFEDAAFKSRTVHDKDTDFTMLRSYKNLFPNLTATYAMDAEQKLSLNYHRRVNRPNFKDLSPFVEVNDPYLYEKGNSALKPEFVHTMELTWLFKNSYSLQLHYNLRQNAISKSYNLDEQRRTVVMPMNLEHASNVGLRFNAASISPLKKWNIQLNGNLNYTSFEWRTATDVHRNRRLVPSLQVQNTVSLPFKLSLELNGFWNGSTAEGQATMASLWSMNTAVRKTILQDKLTLYIYANDLFRTNRPKIIFSSDAMEGKYRELYDSRVIGINLSYRLHRGMKGNLKSDRTNDRLEENSRNNY
ncbi:TonB-dependent receptor domain-containing protein [Sphingobacterium siyangense]|uniref:TonB-dependent receptor domain-containing protein n=1 Tax=Sphingobacterium siyangense TaxID=459529 RepID=UPI003DA50170